MRQLGIKSYITRLIGILAIISVSGYCQSANTLDFSGKIFTEPVYPYYWPSLELDGIKVDRLDMVLFKLPVSFYNTTFDSTADFLLASFDSTADFTRAYFNSTANFAGAKFHSTASFVAADFHSTADFAEANFDSTADFRGAIFDFTANFAEAYFNSTADFTLAFFGPLADFRYAKFNERVFFAPRALPKWLDIRYVTPIEYPIDMTNSGMPRNGNKCKIALTKADVSKIWINMDLFELWFPGDPRYDDQLAVYEGLLKQFGDRGLKESYEVLDKEYRHFVNQHKGWVYKYFTDPFQRVWWGYGYNPERALVITIALWLLFSIINIKYYHRLNGSVYTISFMGSINWPKWREPFSWVRFFLQTSAYTAVIFFGLKMSVDKFQHGVIQRHPFLFSYLMLIYVSGLVCLGFIVNIIFTK